MLHCLFAISGLVLAIVAVYGISLVRMAIEARTMVNSAQHLADAVIGCDPNADFTSSAEQLTKSTRELRDELDGYQWDLVKQHTPYGNDIDAMLAMLDSVDNLTSGPLTDAVNLANQLSSLNLQDRTVDASALLALPDVVNTTRASLDQQVAALSAVPEPATTPVSHMLSTAKTSLQALNDQLGTYNDTLAVLPQLLGSGQARTYLVLVYNPAELRSAGGMVGTVAEITADNGVITIGDFRSTIDYDSDVAPFDAQNAQEAKMFGAQVYQYAQMTTQNPDFERAAITNVNLWKHQSGNADKNVAGVVAIDPIFLQSVLGATSPLSLDDGTVLDGTTTAAYFLNGLFLKHPDFAEQNEYVNKASGEIMNHVMANGGSSATAMLQAVRSSSASGHFKLWLREQQEQDALANDELVNAAAAGTLPSDPAQPVSGVYLNQYQASKLDWYAHTTTEVTKTCENTLASDSGSLDPDISSSPRSTALSSIARSSLGTEYTVKFTVQNTLTESEADSLPGFVKGERNPGVMEHRIYLMAPLDGEITSIASDDASPIANMILPDRQMIALKVDDLGPGETTTIAYTVRVPAGVETPLNVVTTPVINANGIETGSNGQVTDNCGSDTGSNAASEPAAPTAGGDTTDGGTGADTGAAAALERLQTSLSCPVDLWSLAS